MTLTADRVAAGAAARLGLRALFGSASAGGAVANLYILDKQSHITRYEPNAIQRHLREHLTGRDLVLKARQVGISTTIQARYFERAITQTARISTIAHDDNTVRKLRAMQQMFYDRLPDSMKPERSANNATETTYKATGSTVYIDTAGNARRGRGGTYSHVHGSEVAFWADADGLMAGLLQGVPLEGEIVLESTPNGASGWFYDRCMEALDGGGVWKLHFYEWWMQPEYAIALPDAEPLTYTDEESRLVALHNLTPEQIHWRRYKQKELGRLFIQEYPEDPRTCFLVSGVGFFTDIDDLESVFCAPTDTQPQTGRRYVAGLDFGQKHDYTALSIVDAETLVEVDLLRMNRMSWSDMRERVVRECARWGVRQLIAEANSMGTTNTEELRKELFTAGAKTTLTEFMTTPQTKPLLVQAFHYALDEGGLKLLPTMGKEAPSTVAKQEIYAFTASQTPSGAWKYEGLPHDDTVIARMLAWHGIVSGRITLGSSTSRYA